MTANRSVDSLQRNSMIGGKEMSREVKLCGVLSQQITLSLVDIFQDLATDNEKNRVGLDKICEVLIQILNTNQSRDSLDNLFHAIRVFSIEARRLQGVECG